MKWQKETEDTENEKEMFKQVVMTVICGIMIGNIIEIKCEFWQF